MKLVRVQGKVGGQWSADQFDHAYAGQNTLGTVCPLPGTRGTLPCYTRLQQWFVWDLLSRGHDRSLGGDEDEFVLQTELFEYNDLHWSGNIASLYDLSRKRT